MIRKACDLALKCGRRHTINKRSKPKQWLSLPNEPYGVETLADNLHSPWSVVELERNEGLVAGRLPSRLPVWHCMQLMCANQLTAD